MYDKCDSDLKIKERLRLFGNLLVGTSVVIVLFSVLLQWRLFDVAHEPQTIVTLGTEKYLVNSIQEDTVALLNTNDQVSFGKRLRGIQTYIEELKPVHAKLVEKAKEKTLPPSIQDPLSNQVLPFYDDLISSTEKIFLKLGAEEGKVTISEFIPFVKDVEQRTESYLIRLDHLDLKMAQITHEKIQSLRWIEAIVLLVGGLLLIAAGFYIFFPANKAMSKMHRRQRLLLDELRTKNLKLESLESQIRDRLQLALDVSKTGIFSWKKSTNELSWDRNLANLFGIKDERQIAKIEDFFTSVHEEDKERIHEHIARTFERGQNSIDFRIYVRNEVRWVRDNAKVVNAEQGIIVGACTDETDLMREIEVAHRSKGQAEEANRTKTQFIANMSHDMRTPLAAILGFSEILEKQEKLSDDQKKKYLKLVTKNGERLLNLVEELLDTSRLETGNEHVCAESFKLKEMLDGVQARFQKAIQEKGLDFHINCDRSIPETIVGDNKLIERVLDNLVSNAIRNSAVGMISIEVSSINEKALQNTLILRFRVRDQGRGISRSRFDTIFEPFTPREVIQNSHKSTGLGLYIARKLAALMGGDVVVEESEIGKGSVFSFTVPAQKQRIRTSDNPVSKEARHKISVVPDPNQFSHLKILSVEDNADIRVLIAALLSDMGITPFFAEDGEKALDLLESQDFDVVLLDIGLPGIDGIEVTRRLRRSGYTGAIFAVSAHAFPTEKDRAINAGCTGYITKPISKKVLYQALSEQVKIGGQSASRAKKT